MRKVTWTGLGPNSSEGERPCLSRSLGCALIRSSMIDKNKLKVQGLAFGHAFLTAFKIAVMYSVEHPAAEKAVQHSFASLNEILKQTRQFTFGFVNQRVLLNSSLTSQPSLTQIEVEFSKRDIGAVCFDAGITLRDFKRGLSLLTTKPSVLADHGGLKHFLERSPIEGIRIFPAEKPKSQEGDIELGMDAESYLTAQAILEPQARPSSTGLDMLLQAAGVEKPKGFSGTPGEILDLGKKAAQGALTHPEGNLSELLKALSHMLAEAKPDHLLSSFPPGKLNELQVHPAQDAASGLIEDTTAEWAATKLGSSPRENALAAVEEEVLQGLLRGLKATRVAERLLQKLAKFIQEANLPAEIYERIRQQVLWFALPQKEKHARLLELQRFDAQEFRRLVNYIQEVMSEGKTNQATEAARHYLGLLGSTPTAADRAEELKRAPEVLQAIAGVQTLELLHALAQPLLSEFLDETRMHWECHRQLANCLNTITQIAGRYEDFEFVHKIALDLKRSAARHIAQHADCCGVALKGLLAPAAIERLVELYLQKRSDPGWANTVTALLHITGPVGAEIAFRRLEEEAAATNRMQLIRLIGRLGPAALEATRKRLTDGRWYVVRNACYILGDLGDPELPRQLRGALRHPEVRVQQAAATAILKSNESGRGEALGDALPYLQGQVLEIVLDELTFLKDPASVEGLEKLIFKSTPTKAGVSEKAIMILAAVPSDRAAEALYKILFDPEQDIPVRKRAMGGLYDHPSAAAMRLLAKATNLPPSDPMAADLKRILQDHPT